MAGRVRRLWRELPQSLGFVPGVLVFVFAAAGVAVVELDKSLALSGTEWVFQGDGSAARTVLSVIAGSLITVAGLTFSITMVVLQLASSQFSPRILRTFFGDRVTQLTIGIYVGTFVYAILVLRAVGSFGDAGFVPRLSVSLASLMGIAAVILLIVFLNHVSRMVQVSHVAAVIARDTLARVDVLFPEGYGLPAEGEAAAELLGDWRSEPSGRVEPADPGYVQTIDVDGLARRLGGHADRVALLVSPGDFVSVGMAVAELWPAAAAERCESAVRGAIAIAEERDLSQDVGFGVRQLGDVALKAMSPGINDPATAVTCIGYLRSVLVRLAERADPPAVRRFPDLGLSIVVRRHGFEQHLEALLEIGRYSGGDAWVAGELLEALLACEEAARRCGADARVAAIRAAAAAIGEQAVREAVVTRDRARIEELLARFGAEDQRGRS